ncbi:hypothetical protein BGW42_006139 [Actinomortierella wolfii]|nr:hypothetical protein BGW42_006139 [Actinomortierella wolfii]
MKITTFIVAAIALAGIAQSAVIPVEKEAVAAPAKDCGCQEWCWRGNLFLCCKFKPCSGA